MPSKPPAFQSAINFGVSQMTACLARIAEQQQLLQLVRSALPEQLQQHAVHCVASGNKLIIYCRSAAWASQIRFFQTVILNKLQESGQRNLGGLQVRLLLDSAAPKRLKTKRLPEQSVADALIAQSQHHSDELTTALNRLGKTLSRRRRLAGLE